MIITIKSDRTGKEKTLQFFLDAEKENFLFELLERIRDFKAESIINEFVGTLLEIPDAFQELSVAEGEELRKLSVTLRYSGEIIGLFNKAVNELYPEWYIVPKLNYIFFAVNSVKPEGAAYFVRMTYPMYKDKLCIQYERLMNLFKRYEKIDWGKKGIIIFSTEKGKQWWNDFTDALRMPELPKIKETVPLPDDTD